jgi:hypothetical protein
MHAAIKMTDAARTLVADKVGGTAASLLQLGLAQSLRARIEKMRQARQRSRTDTKGAKPTNLH